MTAIRKVSAYRLEPADLEKLKAVAECLRSPRRMSTEVKASLAYLTSQICNRAAPIYDPNPE